MNQMFSSLTHKLLSTGEQHFRKGLVCGIEQEFEYESAVELCDVLARLISKSVACRLKVKIITLCVASV